MNRPRYRDGIGIFKGAKETTVFIKLMLPRGGQYRGRSIPPGGTIEHKLGKRASFEWQQLVTERDRLQSLADRGEPLEPTVVGTFSDYAAEWLERKQATLKTFADTKRCVLSALNPTFGRKTLDAISVADVDRWIGKQRETRKPASVQRYLGVFNSIMNDAVKRNIIDRNPARYADKIKGIEPRQRFVEDDELALIFATVQLIEQEQEVRKAKKTQLKTGWLRHYIMWALHSGMRRSEILKLNFDDILRVNDDVTVAIVTKTKSGKSRSVTLTPEMELIVDELRALPRLPGDNRLFPISLTTLKRGVDELWDRTGLDVRLHDLRRTHATKLMSLGFDARTIAGRIGHTGTDMLAKHYAVDRGDIQAAKAFGQLETPGQRRSKPPL
ncbi:tyrosine-type recombinase/integrase [Novosphingobium piscinae]|nr:site-specific integrase [Novosphingobium piscinae]